MNYTIFWILIWGLLTMVYLSFKQSSRFNTLKDTYNESSTLWASIFIEERDVCNKEIHKLEKKIKKLKKDPDSQERASYNYRIRKYLWQRDMAVSQLKWEWLKIYKENKDKIWQN